nr:piggyBac transposable element-derived protein 4-like [Procambarus clarkii]XP_045612926.1 piggyBac transposable element-derived protein 4-like [Procambarus clarkii]XP_045612927.1 piggyBac transposable element-derived protein 4-like [Procambarus clarkii]
MCTRRPAPDTVPSVMALRAAPPRRLRGKRLAALLAESDNESDSDTSDERTSASLDLSNSDPEDSEDAGGRRASKRRASRVSRSNVESDSTSDYEYEESGGDGGRWSGRKRARGRGRGVRGSRPPSPHTPQWTWEDDEPFLPQAYTFDESNVGMNTSITFDDECLELSIFTKFINESLIDRVVEHTNSYFESLAANNDFLPTSRMKRWKPTNRDEIYILLAVLMLMAHGKKPSLTDYWSRDPLIETGMFAKLMSRDRFLLLMKLLHFVDAKTDPKDDSLFRIRPVYSALKSKFGEMFRPSQKLAIYESSMLWKGNMLFNEYIPSKRNRFGPKSFIVCDCKTEYILDILLYTGDSTELTRSDDLGVSGSVVQTLMENYLDKGHILYLDRWYSSPVLFAYLVEHKTGACGTVNSNRKFMPTFKKKLKKGECQSFHANNILALKWRGKRDVCMLSTVNSDTMERSNKKDRLTEEYKKKPCAVLDYNVNTHRVNDMQIVESIRKTAKWYNKFFLHLVNIASLNSYILFSIKTGEKPHVTDFLKKLIHQLIKKYCHSHEHPPPRRSRDPSTIERPVALRLTGRHFIRYLPETQKKQFSTRSCYLCRTTTMAPQKRKETRYWCEPCNKALCKVPCFEVYHTQKVL